MASLIEEMREQLSISQIRDSFKTLTLLHRPGEASELMVEQIKAREHIYTTRDDIKSEVWIYKEGIYTSQGKTHIKEFVRTILGEIYTEQRANQIIAKIEADTYTDAKAFFNNNIIEEVCIENGIINLLTKELTPHTPKKIFFNKIPITYNPKAKCNNIIKHLQTVLKNEDDIPVLQELFGYLLLKDYRFEKAFMFIGTGRNGKSKTIELMKKFLGIENCSTITLKELESEFSKCELANKMVNLAGDISNAEIKDSSWFKGLTGRDMMGASRKFLTKLYFTNYAKMVFSANELPRTYDISPAFWNRWIILEFPYIFKSQKEIDTLSTEELKNVKLMDEEIVTKLTGFEEMSGLFNWSLEGLDRLIKQRDFSYSKSVNEVRDLWIRKSDSFMAYCIDSLDFNNGESFIEKKELRRAYNEYCKFHKIKVQGDKSIKNTFDIHFGVQEDRKMFCNEWFHVWDGVIFKNKKDVECNSCHLCHGISNHIGITDLAYRVKNGGNPGNQLEQPKKGLPLFPVETDNILLKCSICAAPPPCIFIDARGKPLCELCADSFRVNNVSVEKVE